MIPKECKRLAEVDFPIAVVSKHSAREKSIRHGHPSTLHLWWARRPLAACRSMLLALLLPDPCDAHCPEDFKEKARGLLPKVQGTAGPKDMDLRHALLKFIGDFANWDNSSHPVYLEVGRGLVKAAHPEETPLVVDPFAGGGSIPLEALRLGCETFASDLNPVACLILKVMLEDIPRWGRQKVKVKRQNGEEVEAEGLAEALRLVGKEIKEAAEKELAEFYPADPDGAKPIAYLWARTVRCETPNCGAEIPLMRSFWLCKKASRKRALKSKIVRPNGKPPEVEFEIFEPKSDKEVPDGTVTRAKATCLCCNTVLSPERVRAQLSAQRGGADAVFDEKGNRSGGARLLAVVMLRPGETGRHYRLPTEKDYQAVWKAQKRLKAILDKWEESGKKGLCPVPDEPLRRVPVTFGVINVWVYGMSNWGDLFAARQKLALETIGRVLVKATNDAHNCLTGLSLVVSKLADFNSAVARWAAARETSAATFGRQALPMVWDYCETIPTGSSTGSFEGALEYVTAFVERFQGAPAQVQQADAAIHPLPDQATSIWFTDPPYYDSVPYSYISDYFYVWFKRSVGRIVMGSFSDELTPKMNEIVAYIGDNESKETAYEGYERKMAVAFAEGRRILREDGVGSVVFAHKTTEGWEALLSGMIRGGWTITGSWPIATERTVRLRARDSAALATSVHLVCRPRPEDAPVGDWGDVLQELPNRVGDWMERLQSEHIRGADLVFACIGPALEIFSRYSKVETAEGREVKLAEYLEKVWEVVGRTALEHILGTAEAKARNGAAGALEEDARLTALFLWTLQSTNGENGNGKNSPSPQPSPARGEGELPEEDMEDEEDESSQGKQKGFSLVFDVARRFAQPLGIHLPEWEGRIIKTEKGIVHLIPISERAKVLFGEEGAEAVADRLEKDPASAQLSLFENVEGSVPELKVRGRKKKKGADISDEQLKTRREATTLDRVHAAMILQASGRANALRALLKAEVERSPDFLRLANALSALYPKGSEEKRLLDAMLLAVPR